MSRWFQFVAIGVAAVGLLAIDSRGDGSGSSPRFVATFTSAGDSVSKSAELSVVFLGTEPNARKATTVLRKSLDAASALDGGADIVARAWYSTSSQSAERQPIALEDAATALVYRAADRSISSLTESAGEVAVSVEPKSAAGSDADAIISEAGVMSACKMVAPERLAQLAEVAIESRGERRSQIVRGLRKWSKVNGVNLDRSMSLCVVAISKAAHQEVQKPVTAVADVAEAAKRGAEGYQTANCTRCHRDNGRGGPRAPDLTDDVWVQCDGSVDGIRKILVAGISSSKFKNPDFEFDMRPATVSLTTDQEITDLAVYVKSLSEK